MKPVSFRDNAPGLATRAKPRNRWEKLDLERVFEEEFRFHPTGIYSGLLVEEFAGPEEAAEPPVKTRAA